MTYNESSRSTPETGLERRFSQRSGFSGSRTPVVARLLARCVTQASLEASYGRGREGEEAIGRVFAATPHIQRLPTLLYHFSAAVLGRFADFASVFSRSPADSRGCRGFRGFISRMGFYFGLRRTKPADVTSVLPSYSRKFATPWTHIHRADALVEIHTHIYIYIVKLRVYIYINGKLHIRLYMIYIVYMYRDIYLYAEI